MFLIVTEPFVNGRLFVRAIAVALGACGVFLALPATAVTVSGLYTAEVYVADRTESERPKAFRRAMNDVLVRMTGRRDVNALPELQSLVEASRRFVQQYRYIEKNGSDFLRVVFDGDAVEAPRVQGVCRFATPI